MDRALIALGAVQLAAFWPVGRWLAARVAGDAEAAGMTVALLLALLLPAASWRPRREVSLAVPAALTLVYAAAFHVVPPLVRALIALAALAATVHAARPETSGLARGGLFLLAAPVVPTLQFYLGYPLRLAVSYLAAAWLRLGGLPVSVEGLGLAWEDKLVLVDAPCSGVRMIWGTLLLVFATAVLRRLDGVRTATLVAAGLLATLLANSLRAASLFFTEAGLLSIPGAHEGVGVLAFAATGAVVALAARALGARP